jgi:hypothetical protein
MSIVLILITKKKMPPPTYRDMVCIDEVDLVEAKAQGTLTGLVLVDHNKLTEPLQDLGEVCFPFYMCVCSVKSTCIRHHFPLSPTPSFPPSPS